MKSKIFTLYYSLTLSHTHTHTYTHPHPHIPGLSEHCCIPFFFLQLSEEVIKGLRLMIHPYHIWLSERLTHMVLSDFWKQFFLYIDVHARLICQEKLLIRMHSLGTRWFRLLRILHISRIKTHSDTSGCPFLGKRREGISKSWRRSFVPTLILPLPPTTCKWNSLLFWS